MDEVMLAALLAVLGVGARAVLGAAGIWLAEVVPLRARIEQLQERYVSLDAAANGEILRTCRRLWVAEADRDWAIDAVARAAEERDEARAATALALVYYGKQAERAEAAEQAEVERGLEWWKSPTVGGGES